MHSRCQIQTWAFNLVRAAHNDSPTQLGNYSIQSPLPENHLNPGKGTTLKAQLTSSNSEEDPKPPQTTITAQSPLPSASYLSVHCPSQNRSKLKRKMKSFGRLISRVNRYANGSLSTEITNARCSSRRFLYNYAFLSSRPSSVFDLTSPKSLSVCHSPSSPLWIHFGGQYSFGYLLLIYY